MKLYALSDLHISLPVNREALRGLQEHSEDWLILAGDICESAEDLGFALEAIKPHFAQLLWVPGNHELWSLKPDEPRGEAKYLQMVEVCRSAGVLTPEDPFVTWRGEGGPCVLALLFLLYDYSFRPDEIPIEKAADWAMEDGLICRDEYVLFPAPYPTRGAWCEARCREAEERLAVIPKELPTVLINHFPLRRDLAILPAIPRFSIWCGTRRTEDWAQRFRARAVVSGHLHIRATHWREGVRFEEVSLGYPRQWDQTNKLEHYLREILPGPSVVGSQSAYYR